LLRAGEGPFAQFSFINGDSQKSGKYTAIENLPKTKGEPILNNYPLTISSAKPESNLPMDLFTKSINQNYTASVSKATKTLLKWLLNI
jgi:hypothetical protein